MINKDSTIHFFRTALIVFIVFVSLTMWLIHYTKYENLAIMVHSNFKRMSGNEDRNTQIASIPIETKSLDTIRYNYSGKVGTTEIHAWIEFLESYHHEGTGALIIPLEGYYFYPKYKLKIPIHGEQRINRISFFSEINGVREYFDGESIDFEKISGIWTRKSRSLSFYLNAI